MADNKRAKRILNRMADESFSNERGLWLSFCDTDKPHGKQSLGVIIIVAKGLAHALQKTRRMGINPGGEVECHEVDIKKIPSKFLNRLLSKSDLMKAGLI